MSLWSKAKQTIQDIKDTPVPPPRKARQKALASNECLSNGCSKSPSHTGHCVDCNTAIFGGSA